MSELIKKSDVTKGFRFFWKSLSYDFRGVYEVVCYTKDLSSVYCYKPTGVRATIREGGALEKFDERIIDNEDFIKEQP